MKSHWYHGVTYMYSMCIIVNNISLDVPSFTYDVSALLWICPLHYGLPRNNWPLHVCDDKPHVVDGISIFTLHVYVLHAANHVWH